jgi:hypothetical protein
MGYHSCNEHSWRAVHARDQGWQTIFADRHAADDDRVPEVEDKQGQGTEKNSGIVWA